MLTLAFTGQALAFIGPVLVKANKSYRISILNHLKSQFFIWILWFWFLKFVIFLIFKCSHESYVILLLLIMEFLKFSWSFVILCYNSWWEQDIVPYILHFVSQHTQISPGANELQLRVQCCEIHGRTLPVQANSALDALRSFLPSWSWVSTLYTKLESRTVQQSSGTCPAPTSPPDRRTRRPLIAQVRLTLNNVIIEHVYCPLLRFVDLPKNALSGMPDDTFLPTFVQRSKIRKRRRFTQLYYHDCSGTTSQVTLQERHR